MIDAVLSHGSRHIVGHVGGVIIHQVGHGSKTEEISSTVKKHVGMRIKTLSMLSVVYAHWRQTIVLSGTGVHGKLYLIIIIEDSLPELVIFGRPVPHVPAHVFDSQIVVMLMLPVLLRIVHNKNRVGFIRAYTI